jgi:dihydrofolate reductase
MRVIGVATVSVDGRIAPPDAEGTPFSSRETGQHFFSLIGQSDAVVSGRRTFDEVKEMMIPMMSSSSRKAVNVIMTRSPAAYNKESYPDGLEFSSRAPGELVASLEKRGLESLLVAGGSEIYAAFAAEQLIEEWFIAVEPLILGGGKPLFAFVAEQQLELIEHRLINAGTLLLHYRVKPASP